MYRWIERIRAHKRPGYVVVVARRTPAQVFRDWRERRALSTDLTSQSERSHERIVRALNGGERYTDLLEGYVLSYMPWFVERLWRADGFEVSVVSAYGMSRQLFRSSARAGSQLSAKDASYTNGLYAPDDGGVFVREGTFPYFARPSYCCWQNTEDICGHEMGHYVDHVLDFPSEWDRAFHRAYAAERERLDAYSAADPKEYFATTCWICARFPRTASRRLPETYAYFSELFASVEIDGLDLVSGGEGWPNG